jgi:hypothetical protein
MFSSSLGWDLGFGEIVCSVSASRTFRGAREQPTAVPGRKCLRTGLSGICYCSKRMSGVKGCTLPTPLIVMTVGHSTRPVKEFIYLLKAHRVSRLVDVRTIPRSRHNPQFNRTQLSAALHSARLHYRYMPGLGGFRRARPDSLNTGWRNASFRGFADYMQTPDFGKSLDDLIDLAKSEQTAIMCAEAVPWRCHRSLIADALLARGIEVREIISPTRTKLHTLTPWARVKGMQITYPAEPKK